MIDSKKYMEAMLGISLNSYIYLKVSIMLCLSYYLLCFHFNIITEESRAGSALEVAHTIYTHLSKCKNNKRK
jgi:hypothetical protein